MKPSGNGGRASGHKINVIVPSPPPDPYRYAIEAAQQGLYMTREPARVGSDRQSSQVFAPLAKATTLLFGRIVPALFALAGALFLVTGIRQLNRGWASEAWPSVIGTIVSSDVQAVSRRGSDGYSDTDYRVIVRYTYEVFDQEYTGTRIRFGAQGYNESSTAQEEIRRYPSGKKVDVFYDPENPSTAVLTKGAGGGVWTFVGLGSAFVVTGTFLLFYLPRVMSKRLTAAELQP